MKLGVVLPQVEVSQDPEAARRSLRIMSATEADRLVHRAAIQDLLTPLALAQDERDWATLADCYQLDVVYAHPGGDLHGVAAIVDRTRTALTPLDASQHLLGTMLVTVAGVEATAVTYFQAQHVRHDVDGGDGGDGGELYIIAGTYRDRLHFDERAWHITSRTQEYTWRSGNPEVTRRTPSSTERKPS